MKNLRKMLFVLAILFTSMSASAHWVIYYWPTQPGKCCEMYIAKCYDENGNFKGSIITNKWSDVTSFIDNCCGSTTTIQYTGGPVDIQTPQQLNTFPPNITRPVNSISPTVESLLVHFQEGSDISELSPAPPQ